VLQSVLQHVVAVCVAACLKRQRCNFGVYLS